MSWDRPSAVPSSDPEAMSVATLVKARGAALLDALELHLPGARDHADGTASYAFATAAELGLDRERAREWALGQTVAWAFDSDFLPTHAETARWLLEAA